MGFLRFLALALLAIVALRLLRTFVGLLAGPAAVRRGPGRQPGARGAGAPGAGGPPGGSPERLVEDPVCGLRLPLSRAIRDGETFFCSEECRGRFRPPA